MERDSPLKLIEVLTALINHDRVEEAVDIQLDAISLAVMRDLDIMNVLELSVDDFVKLYEPVETPSIPPIRGWDHVIYGEAAFKEKT